MDAKIKRGLATIADVRARCVVNPATHCWEWQGARQYRTPVSQGMPVMHAFDHALGDKRTMSGPLAMWNIAFGQAPRPGCKVFRACGCPTCLNPAHLREAKSEAEIGLHLRRSGTLKGRPRTAGQVDTIRKMHEAAGIVSTPADKVQAIRSAPAEVTGRVLSAQLGLSEATVSRIRRGARRGDVQGAAA